MNMEIEIAAIITVSGKLGILETLLDKRITRAAFDTVSPTLPLCEKVYKLGEYKRLAANLAVMNHRIRCAIGDGAELIEQAAYGKNGLKLGGMRVKAVINKAKRVLSDLGILYADLCEYKKLPLYNSECRKIVKRQTSVPATCISVIAADCAAASVCFRDGRTVPA